MAANKTAFQYSILTYNHKDTKYSDFFIANAVLERMRQYVIEQSQVVNIYNELGSILVELSLLIR